jgi:hypothetical protein
MIQQIAIDVSSVLRRTVCDLYSNLVTRPTGAAVRTEIEQLLLDAGTPSASDDVTDASARGALGTLTVIDFTHVNLLDFSCADEVVAKLLLRFAESPAAARPAYFLFRGVRDEHLDPIESVLERYGLALVAVSGDGRAMLVGGVDASEREAWQAIYRLGRADVAELAIEIGADAVTVARLLDALHRRRLIMRYDEQYVAVGGGELA